MRLALSTRAAGRNTAALGLLLLAPLHHVGRQADTEVLSNATVVQMVTGKLSRDLIVSKINAARPGFDLSSDGIISLWSNRVDQSVIKLMLNVGESARRRGDAPSALVGLDEVMRNDAVIRMVTAKLPKQLILAKLQISRSAYDVSAAGLVNLTAAKVPEDVIKLMMSPPPPPASPTSIPVREAPAAPAATPTTGTKPASGDTATKPAAASKKPAAKTPTPPPKKPPESGVDL